MDNQIFITAQTSVTGPGNDPSLGMHQYHLEEDGRLIFTGANPGADAILNLEHAVLIGKTIEEVFPGFADMEIPEIFRSVARHGIPWQTEQVRFEQKGINYTFQVQAFQTSPDNMAIIFQDLRARQQIETSIQKRDAILSAVAFAANRFLGNGDWKLHIVDVLARLGQATAASRFYICQNNRSQRGEIVANRLFEWLDEDVDHQACHAWLVDFNFHRRQFGRWVEHLVRGEVIYGLASDFPPSEQTVLKEHEIRSIAIAPIHVEEQWWGLIGYDDCKSDRFFSTAEVDALKTAANTIGAAIQRTRSDEKIKKNAARTHAMVKAGARLSAVLEPGAVASTVCSEIAAALEAKAATVYLYNEEIQELHCAGGYNLPMDCSRRLQPISLTTLNLFLHKWGMPVYMRDAGDILKFFNAPLHKLLEIRTSITWLLLYDQNLIGILNIAFEDSSRILDKDELELLEGLSNQAALAFNNARLFTLEQKRSREISTLYELSVQLNSAQSTLEAINSTLNSVQELMDADAGLALLPDEQKSLLTVPEANGYLSENRGWSTALQETWFENVSKNFTPYIARDFSTADPLISKLTGTENAGPAVLVPLLSDQKTNGMVFVTRKKDPDKRPFSSVDLRLLRTIGELAGTTVQKNQYFEDAQRRLTFLQALRAIDVEITSSLDLEITLQVVMDEVKSQLQVDAVDILTADPDTGELVLTANRGFNHEGLLRESLAHGDHYASTAMQNRRMVILRDINRESTRFDGSKLFMNEKFIAYVAIPLFSKGKVKGVMEVYRRTPIELDQEWLEFLETLSGQAAIAIENVTLFTDLQHSNMELVHAYDTTIEGWSSALDLKDSETEGHTKRVAQVTVLLADALGMNAEELVHVRRGAMLHDIGKMGIPDQILRKPGPLNDDEWDVMRKHPEYAFEWLSPTRYLHPALDIPYCHHEKWDGTGYPQGLKGDNIPLKARTFSVVDVWDALSSDRPYRAKWPQKKVIKYLQEQSGTYFDPEIVPIFLDILENQDLTQ